MVWRAENGLQVVTHFRSEICGVIEKKVKYFVILDRRFSYKVCVCVNAKVYSKVCY